MALHAPTAFSRILVVVGALTVILSSYWFLTTSFAPVPIPPPPPRKTDVKFDPKVDVSKSPVFDDLKTLGPKEISLGSMGRLNPFLPAPKGQASEVVTPTSSPLAATSSLMMLGATTTPAVTTSTDSLFPMPATGTSGI